MTCFLVGRERFTDRPQQGQACRDGSVFPEPSQFKLDRPTKDYIQFGYGPHECLGREIALTYTTGLIKVVAGLKNLRPAPGDMGLLKAIQVGTERCYLNDNWSWLAFDPSSKFLHLECCHGCVRLRSDRVR